MKYFLLIFILLWTPLNSIASSVPSFDCLAGGLTATEQTICVYEVLGDLDIELSFWYKDARENGKDSQNLKSTQTKWLKYRDEYCKPFDRDCLVQLYRQRISEVYANYVDCEMRWCDRAKAGYIESTIQSRIVQYEGKITEILNSKKEEFYKTNRAAKIASIDQLLSNLIEQQKSWYAFVDHSCTIFEDYVGGTGAGDRARGCRIRYMKNRLEWLADGIDVVTNN